MPTSNRFSGPARAIRYVVRSGAYALATVGALFCAVLLALRFHFYPKIEEYRPEIASMLSRVIGHAVTLGGVQPGWDGWNPRLTLTDLTISSDDGAPLLTLPQLDAVVSWRWVLVGQLRMKVLTIDRPSLLVRRDADGHIHVGGSVVDESHEEEDSGFVAWLLSQRVVNIRDGTLLWRDEMRAAPPLRLERVALRLESGLGRYRFGLKGTPPAGLAAPIDLRGDLYGDPLHPRQQLRGELYARLDYLDLAAWQQWVPLPRRLERGAGGARIWLEFGDGRVRSVTGDVDLADVRLPAGGTDLLAVERLSGRVRVRDRGAQREIATEDVRLRNDRGETILIGSSTVTIAGEGEPQVVGGVVRVSPALIEPAAKLMTQLPVPEEWAKVLAELKPRGTIARAVLEWQGSVPTPEVLRANVEFSDLSIAAVRAVPALSGASGNLELTEKGGKLRATARDARLVLPKVFGEPLRLDVVAARAQWERSGEDVSLTIEELTFGNEHAAGSLAGVYRSEAKGPGYADLAGSLSRGEARHVYRYLPTVVAPAVRDWLRFALRAGTSTDARFRLRGRLADFPFKDGNGEFRVVVKGDGGELQYAEGWPAVSGVRAEIAFEGASLRITGYEGRILGATVDRAVVTIPRLDAANPILRIEGTATGPTREFLRFVDESPVHRWIDRFTDGMQAAGTGSLALRLELPLDDLGKTTVAGEFTFRSNRVTLGTDIPTIDGVEGTLAFSERGISADGLTGTLLGGPVRVRLATAEGRVRVGAEGTADMTAVARAYPHPLAQWVSGRSPWTIAIDVGEGRAHWDLALTMSGVTVDLPPPLGKAPDAPVPLRIERTTVRGADERVAARYGADDDPVAEFKLSRSGVGGPARRESALLTFGRATGEPTQQGLHIRGKLAAFDVDRWLAVREALPAPGKGALAPGEGALAVRGIDLRVGALGLVGRWIHDADISAQIGERWRFDVDARELAGTLQWQPHGGEAADPAGRLTARLSRLELQPETPAPEVRARPGSEESSRDDPRTWPAVDLIAESVVSRGRNLGRLRLEAEPRGDDWRVRELSLTNPDGDLKADGWWHGVPFRKTEMDVVLTVRDAGAFLVRYGHAGAVRGAPTVIKGQLGWAGGPQQFDFPTLHGSLRVDTGPGQFSRLDPGIGKLLGVLSLQALPRRIALDFRDVFSEGFAFDELNGDVRIADGVMATENLQFSGPAARVEIKGKADLAAETQDLNVRVQPTLSAGVALGAAIGLANPAIGAAVLLGQKILQDPVEKMFATRYHITGDWDDPQVARLSPAPPPETAVTDLR